MFLVILRISLHGVLPTFNVSVQRRAAWRRVRFNGGLGSLSRVMDGKLGR